MQPYWDLARQSHWHVFILTSGRDVLNWYELDNGFGLDVTMENVVQVVEKYPCHDFEKAKSDFEARYTVEELFARYAMEDG